MNIVVSGASIAGLSTAYWMAELGHVVTIVEIAPGIRVGGTAVDLQGNSVDVLRRMGIFDAIKANRLSVQRMEFKTADDRTARSFAMRGVHEAPSDDAFEIERTALLRIMLDALPRHVEVVFDDSITSITDQGDGVLVTFKRSEPRTFDLVLGCDGMHSVVRKLWFGPEAEYARFLEVYFSVTIVDKLLIEPNVIQMFNEPGKAIMLNAYKDKTDVVFSFFSETEIPYDYRDVPQQRAIIAAQFADVSWRAAELLREMSGASNFYFDKLCQIRMPAWSRGRVALVGDAAHCASPAAGIGGSLSIEGAANLADAMRAHPDDFARAFEAYEQTYRPFVEEIQAQAVKTGLESLVPRTAEAIRDRNERVDFGF